MSTDHPGTAREHLRRELLRHAEAIELDRIHGITDDTCRGRCESYRSWFAHECRGLLSGEDAHDVLDMVLNRLAVDGLLSLEEAA